MSKNVSLTNNVAELWGINVDCNGIALIDSKSVGSLNTPSIIIATATAAFSVKGIDISGEQSTLPSLTTR